MVEGLTCIIADRIATITLDRPDSRNSITPDVVYGLVEMLRAAEADDAVKCVLIQATGKDFSVGGDIKAFRQLLEQAPPERYDTFERKVLIGNRLPRALVDMTKPVVVSTRGGVAGMGVALCLAADFVVASETAYFLLAHVLIGLSLDCGLSGLLVPTMGLKAAKRLAMLGERALAPEALDLGMVTKVVPDETLEEAALALARRLANGPATALRATKSMLHHAAFGDFVGQLDLEVTGVARCAASDDFMQGIDSILNRKPARFA